MNNTPSSFTNILNGINSTLNIVNKAVPIYKESKPIFNTISKTYKSLKKNKTNINDIIKFINIKNNIKKETKIFNNIEHINSNKYNNPTFFI